MISSSSVTSNISTPTNTSTNTTNSRRGGNNTPKGGPNTNAGHRSSSLKRQRNSAAHSLSHPDTEEGDDEANNNYSTFFLKHQNSALASELKQLQYQHHLLEKERDYRRDQCEQANQALHALEATWNSMEVALQLGKQPPPQTTAPQTPRSCHNNSSVNQDSIPPQDAPRSTGTGDSVELIGALLDSLAALGKEQIDIESTTHNKTTDGQIHQKETKELNEISKRVSQRATALQRWIWGLIRKVTQPDESGKYPVLKVAKLEAKLSMLKTQLREYETKVTELSKCRDDAVTSERKVRRGLYRLSAGRMKLNEVMAAIESLDKDGSLSLEEQVVAATASTLNTTNGGAVTSPNDGEPTTMDGAQLAHIRKKLQDLEEIAGAREKQIEELSKEKEENQKQINVLSLPPEKPTDGKASKPQELTDEEIQRSVLYTDTKSKLATSERMLAEIKTKLEETKQKWAQARGDAEYATKGLEDHLAKHKKRWGELACGNGSTDGADDVPLEQMDADAPFKSDLALQAERIAELEHKLTQALENVRQADEVRMSFSEAMRLNESLQSKLDDVKIKNAALILNAKQLALKAEGGGPKTPGKGGFGVGDGGESLSAEKVEKLQKDHRRMRKELAAAQLSKESARNKLERSLKELDSMSKLNARLLRQSGEKDEMNAKSLSTILQLKELTEKLQQEKQLVEQQAKSAGQVNLASRLLVNAKERITEEISKERQLLQSKIDELEEHCETLKKEKETAEAHLEVKNGEMSQLVENASSAKGRCDELVSKCGDQEKEKRRLLESLAVAQREANEAAKRLKQLQKQTGTSSVFTTDQLETQIQHLKSRLTCAVCNLRDKSCILLRCRHMFCKACVEENVRNRSRKCPACGQPFDKKDIGDVWL
mmetsp:Transcript_8730/g.12695  ORF Transcript_8730/g.12695 Transcript_8730/m.12695 type:complete len:887 (-) Transcript_8730:123-2783(-)